MTDLKQDYVTYINIIMCLICIKMASYQAEICCNKIPWIQKRDIINGYIAL